MWFFCENPSGTQRDKESICESGICCKELSIKADSSGNDEIE